MPVSIRQIRSEKVELNAKSRPSYWRHKTGWRISFGSITRKEQYGAWHQAAFVVLELRILQECRSGKAVVDWRPLRNSLPTRFCS